MVLEISSATSYVIAVVVPALDVLIPVLPSESAVIALGAVTAGSADPRIALLVGLAAFGAFLGDNVAYLAGRGSGQPWTGGCSPGSAGHGGATGHDGRWISSASASSSSAGSYRAGAPR